jgi:hypothetical protein
LNTLVNRACRKLKREQVWVAQNKSKKSRVNLLKFAKKTKTSQIDFSLSSLATATSKLSSRGSSPYPLLRPTEDVIATVDASNAVDSIEKADQEENCKTLIMARLHSCQLIVEISN